MNHKTNKIVGKRSIIASSAILIFSLINYLSPALSQVVSIQNGLDQYGFGWMFGRGGLCYVVMPRHVAGPFPRVTISTTAPVETATATVIDPFWRDMDLALGVARGPLSSRCIAQLEDLAETPAVLYAPSGHLLRLTPTGEEIRSTVSIQNRDYLTFTGTLEENISTISQGTSGAFVFLDGRPAGMAVTSDDPSRGEFLRSGEILIHIRRYLDQQGGSYQQEARPTSVAKPRETGELPLQFKKSSVVAINPRFAPENMVSDGQFIFKRQRNMSFIFGFEKPTPVSRISIKSGSSNSATLPKNIIIQWSVDEFGKSFRELRRAQMGPDGVLDTGYFAKRNVLNIEIIILDTWATGNVVIDKVSAF